MTDPHLHTPMLQTGRWFASLAPETAHALLAMAQVRSLAAGETLFRRGDAACGLYAVVRGAIIISGSSAAGPSDARPALLTRLEPPQWFGEIAVFDASVRTHDAHAAEATTLVHVPQQPLRAWLDAQPRHWHTLGLLLSDKLRTAFVAMEELAQLPAPLRLARRLVAMAEGFGQWHTDGRTRRVISISQEQLSMMLSISRQTTNQILKDLEARQLVRLHRGELELLDLPRLREECY